VNCTEKWAGHSGNLRQSIAHSCNSFFSLAYQATVNNPKFGGVRGSGYVKWKEYVNAFGLGNRLGVDLPSEDRGNIPDTAYYNRKYFNSWNSCTNVSLGIGQGEMLATPLQIANTMAIIANRGFFYTPHFVKSIENEDEQEDTLLSKFRNQHRIPVHISNEVYDEVIEGMHDVTTVGTAAQIPGIPGIEICAKTGTAENFHRGRQQKDHSLFACFAPKDDPKIAIAVIVENGGFGSTWAGPMAYLMIEKYLNDSLRANRQEEVKRISETSLLPAWLPEEQYREDSIRAQFYFKLTKDSNYIRRYLGKRPAYVAPAPKKDSVPPARRPQQRNVWLRPEEMVEPPKPFTLRKHINTTA
jgi:penicillin-binding protein 2